MILTVKQTKIAEQNAVKLGVSELMLMDAAGEMTAEFVATKLPSGGTPVFLCGNGGNGGDGFAAAMKLTERGIKPVVILCDNVPKNKCAVSFYTGLLKQAVPVLDIRVEPQAASAALSSCAVAVDCVYGIGFKGGVPANLVPLFAAFNALTVPKISIDIPSGVYADTGDADKHAICADYTLAMIAKKPAHALKRAAAYFGEISVYDLGVPEAALEQIREGIVEITPELLRKTLVPKNPLSNKGTFGRLLCVCGSDCYRGAAVLAAAGGVRCGAGIVEVASNDRVLSAVAANLPEPILYDIFSHDIDMFVEHVRHATALVLGCGLGSDEDARKLVELTLLSAKCPVVLDADGINTVASSIRLLEETNAPLVLTPHLGEFANLCKTSVAALIETRFAAASYFALKHRCVLVLKSENTVVASPKGELFLLTCGNAGLAKGGSGDLLSGMIGAFCAMGIAPLMSALLGCYLHARAADIAVSDINEYALTPSDVANYIADAFDSLIG